VVLLFSYFCARDCLSARLKPPHEPGWTLRYWLIAERGLFDVISRGVEAVSLLGYFAPIAVIVG
jgi:hypothetical protein